MVNGRNKVTLSDKHYETSDGPQRDVDFRVELDGGEEEAAQERLLDDVGLDVQEAWLCEDLIYALQVSTVCIFQHKWSAECSAGRRGIPDTV